MSGVEALLLLSSVLLLMMILVGSKALTGVPRAEIGGVILSKTKIIIDQLWYLAKYTFFKSIKAKKYKLYIRKISIYHIS